MSKINIVRDSTTSIDELKEPFFFEYTYETKEDDKVINGGTILKQEIALMFFDIEEGVFKIVNTSNGTTDWNSAETIGELIQNYDNVKILDVDLVIKK